MKHLKRIFESRLTNDPSFIKFVTGMESLIEKMSDMPYVIPEYMNKSEIEEIREMFYKWDIDIFYEIADYYNLPNPAVKIVRLQNINDAIIVEIRIFKTDDYYFIVEYLKYDPNIEPNIEEMEIEDSGIYQCDTMEGLREFFNKIVPYI